MEDIEPDQIAKSRQMQQKGASFLSSINHLVTNLDNDKPFKLECAELRDQYKEMGLKAADVKVCLEILVNYILPVCTVFYPKCQKFVFQKFANGVAAFFESKCGKLNDAQKKAWCEFFDKFSCALKEAGLD